MRIEFVHLENIRSHLKTEVKLARGFNCLVGGLGCGKSSVLYAIDFALFGDPIGRSYDYLLREGADIGKVAIQFLHDGKTYTLWRALRRHGKGISQDMEQLKFLKDDQVIASAKSEAVAEQLKAITGLEKELFREVVWVRQEHLKELLDVTPRDRQKRLDQLFGLSDYEAAWSALAGFQREYKGERSVYERDPEVTGIGELQAEYNEKVEELSKIQIELDKSKEKFAQAEADLQEANNRLQGLEEMRKRNEELRMKESRLQANVVNIEDINAKLAEDIQRKSILIDDLEERLKSTETQESSYRNMLQESRLKPDQTVEDLQKYLITLEDQMASVRGEQEATIKETSVSQRRILSLKAESKCPLCLQPLTGEYKDHLLEHLHRENAERERRLVELQKNVEELERLRDVVSRVVSNLQIIGPRIEELKSQVAEERILLNNLSEEFGEKQKQERELRERLKLVRTEISKFDITELESARRLRDAAFEHYSDIKHRLETTENRKKDIGSRIDELKQRLDRAQQKIERMEKIGKLLEILDGMRGAYRSIQPKLRSEFIVYLERVVQQVLDNLVGAEGFPLTVKIDETYTPIIKSEEGYERYVSNLSGGERTLLAFAYRLGLGQLIMQARTGHSLYLLLLDEPTESLGREDGSVDRLAEAISRLRAIEQIVAVTHSEAFAEKAEHVIRVEKEAGASRISIER